MLMLQTLYNGPKTNNSNNITSYNSVHVTLDTIGVYDAVEGCRLAGPAAVPAGRTPTRQRVRRSTHFVPAAPSRSRLERGSSGKVRRNALIVVVSALSAAGGARRIASTQPRSPAATQPGYIRIAVPRSPQLHPSSSSFRPTVQCSSVENGPDGLDVNEPW